MKKYVFLTSVLALAACGGGSGGGGAPSGGRNLPDVPAELGGRVTATDNGTVTAMRSEVIVSSNSNVALSRSGHTFTDANGVTFKSYRLEDIKLYAADSVNTQHGYLQIGMNEETGRIDDITLTSGGVGAPVARGAEDTNRFEAPIFEYVLDGHDEAEFRVVDTGQTMDQLNALATANELTGGHWNRIHEVMDVVTYGRNIGNGKTLQYSDFGHFNPVYRTKLVGLISKDGDNWNATETKTPRDNDTINALMQEDSFQLFAGGYAIQGTTLKDTLDAPRNTTFKGMAIGRVYTTINGDVYNDRKNHFGAYGITDTGSYDDGNDIVKAYTTQNATLTVAANGQETLYMPFYSHSDTADKFYDVTLVKNGDVVESFDFAAANENQIGAEYRKYDALDNVVPGQSSFNTGYYGVNVASEAAGTARLYSEKDFGDGVKRQYEVQAAYGMKKQ